MSDYWLGLLTIPAVAVTAAATAVVVGGLLRLWFEWGEGLLKLLPERLQPRNQTRHAAIVATADRAYRLFWVAGFAVYVVNHGPLKSGTLSKVQRVRQAIDRELEEA
ncbi:hypothetical protein [Gordonia sp. NPDC003376]